MIKTLQKLKLLVYFFSSYYQIGKYSMHVYLHFKFDWGQRKKDKKRKENIKEKIIVVINNMMIFFNKHEIEKKQ